MTQGGGIYKGRMKFMSKDIRRHNFTKQDRLGINELKILFKKLHKKKQNKHKIKRKEIIKSRK